MVRKRRHIHDLTRGFAVMALCHLLSACGNGGGIDFFTPPTPPKSNHNQGPATTLVPGGLALAVESGKTTANGYHAKLQVNPNAGTNMTGGGYKVELKHTTRNQ